LDRDVSEHHAPAVRLGRQGRHTARPPARPPITVVVANRKGGVGKTLTTIYTARWLARLRRRVIIHDLDPQRGVWDFAEALGRPGGRVLKHLAVVEPAASPPFPPDYLLVDTPPALDVSLPAMRRADWLLIPVIPDHQPVVQLAKFLEALEETRHERPATRILGVLPVNVRRWAEHQTMLRHVRQIAAEHARPILDPVPNSRAVLRYSLAGGLWRQVAEALVQQEPAQASASRRAELRGATRDLVRV
jgi:chromosome partitioning protein